MRCRYWVNATPILVREGCDGKGRLTHNRIWGLATKKELKYKAQIEDVRYDRCREQNVLQHKQRQMRRVAEYAMFGLAIILPNEAMLDVQRLQTGSKNTGHEWEFEGVPSGVEPDGRFKPKGLKSAP